MKSIITYSINPLEGIIKMLKFTTLEDNTISNSKFKEFCQNVQIICDTQNINSITELKHRIYNKDNDIDSYIESLNEEMKETIKIIDFTICSLPSLIERAYFECYNAEYNGVNQGASIAFTCKEYTDEVKKFINELLIHISTNKPLVIYENQLLDSIIEYEQKNNKMTTVHGKTISKDIRYFLKDAILEKQWFTFNENKEKIKDLLTKYQIDIVDFDYI